MADFHQIAGYDVVSTLGEGAHSTIYEVRDKTGQIMVLKRVIKEGPSQQRFIDQALAEHDVASKIDHPRVRKSIKVIKQRNVIRVSEVLVLMEMVNGKTLEQHRPTDLLQVCQIYYQAAEGLQAMHQAGFVHADIKPNNIMITQKEGVKLIDFGQSCKSGTIKHRIQGTPDYIAPEQVKREAITERTDVFNLGATFYWILTGQHIPTMMHKKQKGSISSSKSDNVKRATPPIEINPEIAPALSSLVMDSIERKVDERPQNMGQIIDRLQIAGAQIQRQRAATAPKADVNA
ncbi:serine/threonine protein kinase [Algisphaera agarilytica]|uniref:Serine/threonine-protein kinase n=1 Tax=Algisphaera agarilytica TaxID=1385975 RepID=A0A7X0H3R0_9BACT|nr:serine/threonine-protein kinase [Algisphaera agarilytica]MBB6428738.1 serine/threonine-protein kinase [Algisphaera agarilytica]